MSGTGDATMLRVLLVDDQALVRAGLRQILTFEADISIVAEAEDGAGALQCLARSEVDVVVMDVRMSGMDGTEATRRIRNAEGPPVLALTTFDDDETLWAVIRSGAAGFILKEAPAEDIIRATRLVAAGGSWLDPAVTPRVLSAARPLGPAAPSPSIDPNLTPREHEVLVLMATGATNTEIATELNVGAATVKTHVSSIFSKLGARDRAGAIVYAYQHGLTTLTNPE